MKILKRIIICILLIGIGAGGMEICTRLMRQNYVPKESKLLSSDISIDSIVQTYNSNEGVNLSLIAKNTSSQSITGEVVFEVELDPLFLDTHALEETLDKIKADKAEAELMKIISGKLENPKNFTSRQRKAFNYINSILKGEIEKDYPRERYLVVENTDLSLNKYIFRSKNYLNLKPLEVASFDLSSPMPPGLKFSKPTIRAISVFK